MGFSYQSGSSITGVKLPTLTGNSMASFDYNKLNIDTSMSINDKILERANFTEFVDLDIDTESKSVGDIIELVGATCVVSCTSVVSGVLKIIEYVDDANTWIEGMVVSGVLRVLGLKDVAEFVEEKTMNEIARDKVGELNKTFYEGTALGQTINENSALKYDSELAKGIQNVTTEVVVIVGATAATVVTGGAAAPLFVAGFAIGAGQSAEKRFQDTENRDFWKDSAHIGIDGVFKGLSTIAAGKAGAAAVNGIKAFGSVGLNGIKVLGKSTLNKFSKEAFVNTMKNNAGKIAKQAALNTIKDKDTWLETAAVIVDDVKNGLDSGEWRVDKILLDAGGVWAGNFVGNFGSEYLSFSGVSKKNVYDFDNAPVTGVGTSGKGLKREDVPNELFESNIIIEDDSAVFGYRAISGEWKTKIDVTDYESMMKNRRIREQYLNDELALSETIELMAKEGKTPEEIANYAVTKRNQLKVDARAKMDVKGRTNVAMRNVVKYSGTLDKSAQESFDKKIDEIYNFALKKLSDSGSLNPTDSEIYDTAISLIGEEVGVDFKKASSVAIGPDFEWCYRNCEVKLKREGISNPSREHVLSRIIEGSSKANPELNILLGLKQIGR